MYGDYTQQQQPTNNRGEYSLSSTPVPQQLQSQPDTDSLANSIVSGAISPIPGSQTGGSSNRDIQRVISTNQICLDGNGNASLQMQVQQQQSVQQQQDDQQHQQQSSSSFSINNNSNSMSNNYSTPNTAAAAAAYSNSAALGTSTIPRPMQKVTFNVGFYSGELFLNHF